MRFAFAMMSAVAGSLLAPVTHRVPVAARAPVVERVLINDNRAPAGIVRDGVLTVRLEARDGQWHPDGDAEPGLNVRVFAERGKRAQIPGPLLRVREGTEIRAFVTNTFSRGTLIVYGLSPRGAVANVASDTIQILAGATREVRFVAGRAGTYYYRGELTGAPSDDTSTRDAELNGAFIIDPPGARRLAPDRVIVISMWNKAPLPGGLVQRTSLLRFTMNGKTWPNTERLSYARGDTIRFRVVNVSNAVHPMHLHGFYFKVDSRGNGSVDTVFDRAASPRMVVTERTTPGRTFSMTWVAERSGNWLFHCHDNYHVLRNAPLDGSALPAEHLLHVKNHAMEMMGGLVMGIQVRGTDRRVVDAPGTVRRKLRLLARVDSGGTEADPAYGYVLQEGAAQTPASGPLLPGPTILLKRGQPVSITVVNELREQTAVHWHGIELESYFDGVAGFAGSGRRLAPAIAPGDSFVARFTPPRSGTFMYHPHADEVRQQQAGLTGALLVLDSPAAHDPASDIVLLLTVPRATADAGVVLVNGSKRPAAIDMRVGQRYRLRLVDVHTFRPSMVARLLRDSTLLTWRAVAKDGWELPPDQATTRPSMQQMGNGETFDFEFIPDVAGEMMFTVSSAAGVLLARVPVVVK